VTIQQQASTLGNGAFSPDTLSASLAAGGSVIWYNGDVGGGVYGGSGTTHHMVSDVNGVFDTGTIGPGATGTATFASQGPVGYHCSIHPTMVGVINVGP
jgi:plastocyanin